ncbi:hypothetical protein E2C01_063738 [Portunus trituberculatus]|uniref:Uncharacterized protein n=1 Tax=Portunus trituberculatus TaxID=210409 RepID=A0A5B7HEH1_PORTR|nr:hypothetical protein [Portunus trituberculatus]
MRVRLAARESRGDKSAAPVPTLAGERASERAGKLTYGKGENKLKGTDATQEGEEEKQQQEAQKKGDAYYE